MKIIIETIVVKIIENKNKNSLIPFCLISYMIMTLELAIIEMPTPIDAILIKS